MDFDSFRREAMSDQASIDPKIRIEESTLCTFDGLRPRNLRELIAYVDGGRFDLPDLRRQDYDRSILFIEHLFVLPFQSFARDR